MRVRKNHPVATDASSLVHVKRLAIVSGVVTACAAALGGACGDPSTTTTTGAGGSGMMSSSSSGKGGMGGEDLNVVAGSVTIGSTSSSNASSSGGPKCPTGNPMGGLTKFASAYGDANVQTGSAIAYDKSGNVLVAGSFSGSINFGAMSLTGTDDVFVAKFDPAGKVIWAKSFGDGGLQTASGIGVDVNGNVYVTGSFKGSINFGGGALAAKGTLFVDVFLAKLTSDGTHVWSKSFGDENVQNVRGLSVDGTGNVVIAGFFQNDINFGGMTLTTNGLYDMFVAKFDTGGTHLWSRRFGDMAADQSARAVTADATGNVYIAGDVAGTIDVGGGTLTATATQSAFVAKLDPQGNALWAKLSAGTMTSKAIGNAISVGPTGDVAVGGNFRGDFDLGGPPIPNPGSDNGFVTVFTSAGAHTLTKTLGDNELQTVTAVAIAGNNEVFAAGNFSGSVDFDTGMPVVSAGALDGFVVRLNSKGCPAWLRTFPGPMVQLTHAMSLDPTTGGVALTGSFNGSVEYGQGMLTASGDDVFLVAVNP